MTLELIIAITGIAIPIVFGTISLLLKWNKRRLQERKHIRELVSLEQSHQISLGGRKMLEPPNPFIDFLYRELKKTYFFWTFRKSPKSVVTEEWIPRPHNTTWLNRIKTEWKESGKVKDFTPW